MAGRPLRRLRNALRLNPLVGWEDLSGVPPREVRETHVTLVKPGAKEAYERVYTRVGLPLVVVLHPPWPAGTTEDAYLYGQGRSYAPYDLETAERLGAVVLSTRVRRREETRWYARSSQKRGRSERISPYTPFVLLHRLGDILTVIRDRETNRARPMLDTLEGLGWDWSTQAGFDPISGSAYSRGVDTAAGRMGVLSSDYLSDLWAKWLLTGRVAYSPTEPPPESPEEALFRNKVAEYAPQIFRIWYDYLDRNRPMVINV